MVVPHGSRCPATASRPILTAVRDCRPVSAVNLQLESRMREIRPSGSEGGGAQPNAPFLPLSRLRTSTVARLHVRHGLGAPEPVV